MSANQECEKQAVFVISEEIPQDVPKVKGYDFQLDQPVDYTKLFQSYLQTGFQATNLALAIEEVKKMLTWTSPVDPSDPLELPKKCTIFLGYTSNLISSGLRDIIRFLVQHKMVDVIVTSAGGIEEDFIKCLGSLYVGSFHDQSGPELRLKGQNRIGNLLMPNRNYCAFEEWLTPIFDKMLEEQEIGTDQKSTSTKESIAESMARWTPSTLINRLGKEINNPESVYYWAWRNEIPVFCPGITDGSLGDILYFHSYKANPWNSAIRLDVVEDLRALNRIAVFAACTGIIILGGGIVKHHICNANLMRNGADFAVFVNTGVEHDGSDSGASPDEAISWGKIKITATPVKVWADATLVFPIIVSESFAKYPGK